MSFRTLVKNILPAPVTDYLASVEQQVKLAAIDPTELLPENLHPANDFYLDIILNNEEAAHSWAEDSEKIFAAWPQEDLYGGVNPGDRRALYTLVRALKPASILEVGTHVGSSTVHIAQALKTNGGGHLTTVDIYDVNHPEDGSWKKYQTPRSIKATLEALDLDKSVTFSAEGALNFLKNTDLNFDMIFLDGDHAAAAVYQEVSLALKHLSQDGIIILHDYCPHGRPLFDGERVISGPYLGMRRLIAENPRVKVVPLGNLPWATKKGVNTTSLAVVLKA